MTASTAGADDYVDALLLRVDSNLPIKTGEPSALARRNLVHTQDCFIRLCSTTTSAYHVSLVNGLVRILRQLVADYSMSIGQKAPEVEENYRQSVHYVLETIWKCIVNSPPQWSEPDQRNAAYNLLHECAKLVSQFSDKPFWFNEILLVGKLVCELSRCSFSSVSLFFQQLFSESERDSVGDESFQSSSPIMTTNDHMLASFSLIQYFDLGMKQLSSLMRDFAEKVRPAPKKPFPCHILHCAPSMAVLLWRTIDHRTPEFVAIHSACTLSFEKDEFYEPCLRIFEACSITLANEKSAKFTRQPVDKEKIRQQVWPLMMACIVFSPRMTAGVCGGNNEPSNEKDTAGFIESLRSKLKRTHEYEFVAPILARFCGSLGRLPSECCRDDLSKQLLPAISTELKQFLISAGQKPSKHMPQSLEDSAVQTLCICLNLSIFEPHYFKSEELLHDLFTPIMVDPIQGSAGPTIVAIALKALSTALDDCSSRRDLSPYRVALSTAAGRRMATFFTQLATHYLSTSQSSSSQSGGSGGSGSGYMAAGRVRSLKGPSRSERPSVDDNNTSMAQSIVYFLELFIAAPKLVVMSADVDPGLMNELTHSICGLLDKPMFKKCVRAIERLSDSLPFPKSTSNEGGKPSAEIGLNRLRMLTIPIDAFSKRMIQNCSQVMLTDFVTALNLLSSKLFAMLSAMRQDAMAQLLTVGNEQTLLKDTIQRFERALISRLWTTETSTVIIILDCVANLCKIVETICQGEDFAVMQFCPNLHSYAEMSNEMRRQSVSLGRVALQKHVLTSLRTLRYPSLSVVGAWECVFNNWERKTRAVLSVLKGTPPIVAMASDMSGMSSPVNSPSSTLSHGPVYDASTSPGFGRSGNQRRPSNLSGPSAQPPTIEVPVEIVGTVDDLLVEWSHMTYFLAALADAYFKHRAYQRKGGSGSQTPHSAVAPSLSADAAISKPGEDNLSIYVSELLRMLVHTSEEKYGVRVERCVRESLGGDLRPPIQSIVIEEAHKLVTKCLDIENRVVVSEQNTLFVSNVTLLFKMMLDKPSLSTRVDTQVSNTLEDMIGLLRRYVETVDTPKLHLNFCSLLLAVLHRREEMGYRLETKFRAKVVDYLLTNFHNQSALSNELVLLQLKTMSTVLARFSLIMEPSGGNGDHSYRLRTLKLCAEFIVEKSTYLYRNGSQSTASSSEIDEQCHQALLNLLLYNGDVGLSASLSLTTAPEARIRSSYLDALSRFIRQGISNSTPVEGTDDEFASLAELVTMLDDRGELPVVMALAEVVPAYQLRDLARLLTHLFDAKHLLSQLVINVLSRELSISQVDTVLRGSNLASYLLSYSFQTFGSYYVADTIGPIAKRLMTFDDAGSYEVNPDQIEGEANIEENRQNLKDLVREILGAVMSSRQRFPAKLRSLCRCVHAVLAERFPQSNVVRLTGGTLVFLRFINPFLTNSFEFGLIDRQSKTILRAFTLVAKLLQTAANGQTAREEYMKPFNEFIGSLTKEIDEFVDYLINSDEGAASSPAACSLFLGESVRHSLHYFLYTNQERVADCLRERRLIGRKPLDRLETLLNKLGPVELSFYLASYSSAAGATPTPRPSSSYGSQSLGVPDRLEPYLAEQIEKLREAKIFYHYGHSTAGNPVFYLVPKHTRAFLSDFGDTFANAPGSEALATLIITQLKPFNDASTKWELVVDLTQAPVGVIFKSDLLQKLSAIPDAVLNNLTTIYIYQCSPVLADYARLHDRFVANLRQNIGCRFVFPETQAELRTHVPQLKLPQSTMVLDEEARTFRDAIKMSRQKAVSMNVQTNRCAIKISTAERVRLFAGCLLFVVETYVPEDVEDVQLDASKQQISLILRTEPVPVILSHPQAAEIYDSMAAFREKIAAVQQTAARGGSAQDFNHTYHSRGFLATRMAGSVPVRLRDISAFLLTTGLINLSSGVPMVQSSALNLMASLCHRFDLHIEDDARLLNLLRITSASSSTSCAVIKHGKCFSPVWSSDLVTRLSLRICQSAPWLTLDFIAACSFYLAAESQLPHMKSALCECLRPWLDSLQLSRGAATADSLSDQSSSSLKPSPTNDAIGSIVSAFIDLPSNAHLISAIFPKLHDFFDVILDSVLSQQTGIQSNETQKVENALVVLVKTAASDRSFASRVLAKYIEEMILQFPTKLNASNNRMVFFVRLLNSLLAEDIFETNTNGELLIHFSLSLVGSGVPLSGESIYSLLYNSVRSFLASFSDVQFHRSLSELTEPKYTDLFTADYRNSTSTSNLASETWTSLLDYLADIVSVADKAMCNRWADLCRRIIDASLVFSQESTMGTPVQNNSSNNNQVTVLAPSVREAVRVLGFLSALPPANMVMNTVDGDVEKILRVLGSLLQQKQLSQYSANVTVGISGALSFFARVTSNIPASLIAVIGDFFWLALAFLLSDEPTIYADALLLFDSVIAALWARTSCPLETILSCYQRHGTVFSNNFAGILPAATASGLDLRDHIHFVLARLLFKSIDHPDNTISGYASRLLLRLHQPYSASQPHSQTSVFANSNSESSRARTVVYSLVAHIIMPEHGSRPTRRATRGSSVGSSATGVSNANTNSNNTFLNNSCGCWDDRLMDIERLDGDEKLLCCEFLFALLLATPKNSLHQQPILIAIAHLFAAPGADSIKAAVSSLLRLSDVKTRLADLLRTTHDPDTLTAAEGLLEHVAPGSVSHGMECSLFASLHRIPITFAVSNGSQSLLTTVPMANAASSLPASRASNSGLAKIADYYGHIAEIIIDGCLQDCNMASNCKKQTSVDETQAGA